MAAIQWLELLDKRDYEKSWEEAGALFKQRRTEPGWEVEVGAARAPFGSVYTRFLTSATITGTGSPGEPLRHHAVVRVPAAFSTSEHTRPVMETVTLADEDGGWKVTEYSIGPQ